MAGVPPIGFLPPSPRNPWDDYSSSLAWDIVQEGAQMYNPGSGTWRPFLDVIPNPEELRFSFDFRGSGRLATPEEPLEISAVLTVISKTNGVVQDGVNAYGFPFMVPLTQLLYVSSTIRFDPSTGVPIDIVDTEVGGRNRMSANSGFGTTTTISPLGPEVIDGQSFGPWTAAVLTWPMWEISGSQFRFFGQNWIRLIKVSGP